MLKDLSNYHEPLAPLGIKWQSIIANDFDFIQTFCEELLEEDKLQAIP